MKTASQEKEAHENSLSAKEEVEEAAVPSSTADTEDERVLYDRARFMRPRANPAHGDLHLAHLEAIGWHRNRSFFNPHLSPAHSFDASHRVPRQGHGDDRLGMAASKDTTTTVLVLAVQIGLAPLEAPPFVLALCLPGDTTRCVTESKPASSDSASAKE